MKLLVDTHVALWWQRDDRRLNQAARRAISRADIVWVSAVSGWEVTIKTALGRLRLDEPFRVLITADDFTELPMTLAHAEAMAGLPAHHTDPFDREGAVLSIVPAQPRPVIHYDPLAKEHAKRDGELAAALASLQFSVPKPLVLPDVKPLRDNPEAGEGVWTTSGLPRSTPTDMLMAKTFVRPDKSRPYALVGVLLLDSRRIRL